MEKRKTLSGLLWLLDIRHDPSAEDREYGDLVAEQGLPMLVAVTKADKLPFGQRQRRLAALCRALALPRRSRAI